MIVELFLGRLLGIRCTLVLTCWYLLFRVCLRLLINSKLNKATWLFLGYIPWHLALLTVQAVPAYRPIMQTAWGSNSTRPPPVDAHETEGLIIELCVGPHVGQGRPWLLKLHYSNFDLVYCCLFIVQPIRWELNEKGQVSQGGNYFNKT